MKCQQKFVLTTKFCLSNISTITIVLTRLLLVLIRDKLTNLQTKKSGCAAGSRKRFPKNKRGYNTPTEKKMREDIFPQNN